MRMRCRMQMRLGGVIEFAISQGQFHKGLPPPDNLTDAECRAAWARDLDNKDIEHEKLEVYNRKTGQMEIRCSIAVCLFPQCSATT